MSIMTLLLGVLRILMGRAKAAQVLPEIFPKLGVTTVRPPLTRVVTTCAIKDGITLMVPGIEHVTAVRCFTVV